MQTTTQGLELSVAILMDDLGSAREIASALRAHHILAHHYQNLDEFWVASKLQTPDLVIVDVTKMSQGSIQFRSHPKVLDKTLSYVFFSKDSTKVLLQSTLGLSPLGYLHHDSSLNVQIYSFIKQRTSEIKKSKDIAELEGRIQRLQGRSQRMISDRSEAEEFRAHFSFIRNFCSEIEEEAALANFTHSLISKLEKWDALDAYGLYELNPTGQKLIASDVTRKKYHPFPSLWLGQTNSSGIEKFAEDMALQVAQDLFESEPILVRIHAASSSPDILLFVSFKEQRMTNFPWDVMESMLSSSLRRLKLHQQLPQYSSQFMPMWEALDSMDRLGSTETSGDLRIISLSLVPLTDVAKKKSSNKFFWSAFFNDFFLQLSGRLQKSTKLSLFGPWHVVFFIPKESVEIETQMLQTFIRQFSYWKFFEDNSQVLTEEMKPVLSLLPASSAQYLRIFEKEFRDSAQVDEGRQLMNAARVKDSKRLVT
ncbi:MAG TPA: hypothetical protein VNJ01_06295 [Bacteriovoracaceae bacterium]|nr:hypothetical protein [Bacteriovoracaceae bacterium]